MESFSLAAISHDEYAAWFDQYHPLLCNRSPFHHPAYLDAVAKGMQVRVVFIGIYQHNDLIGAVPGFLSRRGPFQLYGSPLRGTNTSYLGPVMVTRSDSDHNLHQLIEDCSRYIRKHYGAQYTEFALKEPLTREAHEPNLGWEHVRPASYSLDLRKGKDTVWSGMVYRARKHIRKSEKLGIEIIPLDNPTVYYMMLEETFERRGIVPSHPKRFFQAIFEDLVPRDLVWPWAARYQGQIISAGLFLHDDREMHYLSGASLSQYRSLPTSYLLHWHAIEVAIRDNLSVYDLTGRGVPSIDQFKESFGPETIEYESLYWAPAYVRLARKGVLSALPYIRRFQRWRKSLMEGNRELYREQTSDVASD